MRGDLEFRAAVRAEVRAYVGGLTARYVPVLVGALAVVLLIALVPDKGVTTASSGLGGSSGVGVGSGGAGGLTGGATPSATGAGTIQGTSATTGGASTANGSTTGAATAGGGGPATAQAGFSASGIAVNGTKCGPGVRQVSFTPYAPMCLPKWQGNNGGATAHGVTATTITVIFRDTSDLDAINTATGAATFSQQIHDAQAIINYLNGQYELYGRHVVVKTFTGQGNYTQEAEDQDQAGANTDAQTAYGDGAFAAELENSLGSWASALASHHIITPTISDLAGFQANAPYLYGDSQYPLPESTGSSFAALTCQRMAHLPAIYAGDPVFQHTTRTFAAIEPEAPGYTGAVNAYAQQAKSCGVTVKTFQYTFDINQEPSDAAQIDAQLKAAGITTVMFWGDPLMPTYLTQAAAGQNYNPEWVFTDLQNTNAQSGGGANASEMAHAMNIGPWPAATQPETSRMCYRIYKLADPGGAPQSDPESLDTYCSGILAFFAALQAAGPDLTPTTFQHGWFSLPPSAGSSDFGTWGSGANQWSPGTTFNLQWWNGNATSPTDGGTGEFLPCNQGAQYYFTDPKMGSGQPACFS